MNLFSSVMGTALPKTKCRYLGAIGKIVSQLLERHHKSSHIHTCIHKRRPRARVLYMA